MKTVILLSVIAIMLNSPPAQSRGGSPSDRASGGGDLCENRIKSIRDDLRLWIQKGEYKNLNLPSDVSPSQYEQKMLKELAEGKTRIKCVGPGDQGYPVEHREDPKTCRFDRIGSKSSIRCDREKFASESESQQYVLIHHEYAGLAGLELPTEDGSIYRISTQISGKLQTEVVKKLVVTARAQPVQIATKDEIVAQAKATMAQYGIHKFDSCNWAIPRGHMSQRAAEEQMPIDVTLSGYDDINLNGFVLVSVVVPYKEWNYRRTDAIVERNFKTALMQLSEEGLCGTKPASQPRPCHPNTVNCPKP